MLTHEDRGVGVVEKVAPQLRQLFEGLSCDLLVAVGRHQDSMARRRQDRRDEAP
jgi:hypothetical protein